MKIIVTNGLAIMFLFMVSCQPSLKESDNTMQGELQESFEKIKVKYAKGFALEYLEGYKIVRISNPWQGSNHPLTYVLRQHSTKKNDSILNLGKVITIPLNSIICNSTSHLMILEELKVENKLIGFAQTQYIYSEKIKAMVKSGQVAEVGIEAQMNIEKILDLNPDAIMAFSAGQEDKQLTKLEELGLDVLMNADYLETTLLGRAEWIKFAALFFNKEREANQYFEALELRYDSLLGIVERQRQPTVMSGTVYGSTWFMPAGNNYNARLIADSGGDYLWSDHTGSGWLNLDFEVVYDRAVNADYWIGAADFKSLEEMQQVDARYADFDSFKKGNVYTYTGRINGSGGNDYFESGNINPDLILSDHIKILHSELLPDYELNYYKRLE